MKMKPILIGLILLIFLALPVLGSIENPEYSRVLDKNGNVVREYGNESGSSSAHVSDDDSNEKPETKSKDDNKNNVSSELDVWGLQNTGIDFTSYVNVGLLGGVYSSIIPLRNLSIVSVAVSFGMALISTIVGIFLLVLVAGYGAAHPNTKRGWDYITSSRSKILALGGVFFVALFMIVLMFFFLYIFSQMSWFGM